MTYGSNPNDEYMVERVNKGLKRRNRVAGDFPNEESLLRLVDLF